MNQPWVLVNIVGFGAYLAYGTSAAYKARKLPSSFNESGEIANACMTILLFGIIIGPLCFLVGDDTFMVPGYTQMLLNCYID